MATTTMPSVMATYKKQQNLRNTQTSRFKRILVTARDGIIYSC